MKSCLRILLLLVMGMTGCKTEQPAENPKAASIRSQDKPTQSVDQQILSARTEADLDKLLEEFSGVIRQNPTHAAAYFNRGRVYDRRSHYYKTNPGSDRHPQDEYEMAVADYTKAIELDPGYARAYQFRGRAHYYKSEPGKAVKDYTASIRINPDDVTYVSRGFAYAMQHEFDKAIADYNTAIQLNPASAVAYYNRALANKALGDVEQVKIEADFSRARELGFED